MQTDLASLLKDGYEEPKREPATTFADIGEYITYFEPLIVTELRAEFANAVDKFAKEGGEKSAFRQTQDAKEHHHAHKRKDEGDPLRLPLSTYK